MNDSELNIEILILDDNEMSGLLATTYLRKIYQSEYFTDPKKALLKLKTYQYRAILLDLDLGAGIRGEDILAVIRTDSANMSTPVFALTGFSGNNESKGLLKSGFNGYLAKPYSKSELLELLNGILK